MNFIGQDLKSQRLIVFKAFLFLVAGLFAIGLLLADSPSLKTASLIGITIWAFCRLYYFAFYVIENYVDPSFKYSGLTSMFTFWTNANQ